MSEEFCKIMCTGFTIMLFHTNLSWIIFLTQRVLQRVSFHFNLNANYYNSSPQNDMTFSGVSSFIILTLFDTQTAKLYSWTTLESPEPERVCVNFLI